MSPPAVRSGRLPALAFSDTEPVRRFNVAGPVDPEVHYTIPPLSRVPLRQFDELVERREYFVLHAPRQTGKTSVLKALRDHLNERGWRCVYASCEDASGVRDLDTAVRGVLGAIASGAAEALGDESLREILLGAFAYCDPADGGFEDALRRWSKQSGEERLVLLLDETDAPEVPVLVSLLSQVRPGHADRPRLFPRSMVFCGLRNVQVYPGPSGIPFNIVYETFRLADFSPAEVEELLGQHTEETGQRFAPEAVEEIWNSTAGQPWLVNALADEACFRDEAGRDRSREIGPAAVEATRERLILAHPTHFRQIGDKLNEERVRRVIEPILAGRVEFLPDEEDDDIAYVADLGLTKADEPQEIANPIYREVIPRLLSTRAEKKVKSDPASFRRGDGSLDVGDLLTAFQQFFREHSESWSQGFTVREAALQVLLQAFLQRVVNAGGRIVREYGLGRGRTDLLIEWRLGDGTQRFVVECKVRRERDGLDTVIREGAAQTAAYLDRCGAEEGHLVVMDQDEGKTWEEKVFRRSLPVRRASAPDADPAWEVAPDGDSADGDPPETRPILVWGM